MLKNNQITFTMKKIMLLGIVFFALFSCKKNDSPFTENEAQKNSDSKIAEDSVQANSMREISSQKLTDLLQKKANDTLYVTNFFATWCHPCVGEIPGFVEQIKKRKDQKVKFTFISLDSKEIWNTTLLDFISKNEIKDNTYAFDFENKSNADFAKKNTKTWDGGSIPFTIISKGANQQEFIGSISEEELEKTLDKANQGK